MTRDRAPTLSDIDRLVDRKVDGEAMARDFADQQLDAKLGRVERRLGRRIRFWGIVTGLAGALGDALRGYARAKGWL